MKPWYQRVYERRSYLFFLLLIVIAAIDLVSTLAGIPLSARIFWTIIPTVVVLVVEIYARTRGIRWIHISTESDSEGKPSEKPKEFVYTSLFRLNLPALMLVIVFLWMFPVLELFGVRLEPQPVSPTSIPIEIGLCGAGQPVSATIPMGPGEFDRQFGFTFYNINNSRELALDSIRSLLSDGQDLWVGYGGLSNIGRGGLSFVSHELGGYRLWQYCADPKGKPIGHQTNALAKAKDNALWVATDGDGAWRLQGGKWQQFVYDSHAKDIAPNASTFALAASETSMLAGTLDGIMRWTGATWERTLLSDTVHALAIDEHNKVWVGFVNRGISLNPWDRIHEDFNVSNGSLSSDAVRSLAIDSQSRVWAGTDGGGLSVFDNGHWRTYRADNSGLLTNTVLAVGIDKYDRVWAATTRGTNYFDGSKWFTYTTVSSSALAFVKVEHKPCSPEDSVWDVWIGTGDKGLLSSRLPPNSNVVMGLNVSDVPTTALRSKQSFTPTVTITLEKGYPLIYGDFLQAIDDDSHTLNPLIGLPEGAVIPGGQPYAFSFEHNPMITPDQNGTYRSHWRLWQCGRYVGQTITIDFTVKNP